MARRTLLQIGGSLEHIYGVNAAHELGYDVLVVDGNPAAPAFSKADCFRVVSTYDHVGVLDAAREYVKVGGTIDGVWTVASDVPLTVAYVAHHLGLFSSGIPAGWITSDKWRMQRMLDLYDVPHPRARLEDASVVPQLIAEYGFPVIVKPTDSRGGRGVNLVSSKADAALATRDALAYTAPGNKLMIQEYFPGPQLSVEGYMVGSVAFISGIFDRNYEYLDKYAPHIVENGGEMPSKYAYIRDEIKQVMEQAALACCIHNGPIKGDLVVHNDKVKVIEIANRLSGGFFATVAIPASTGVDLVKHGVLSAMRKSQSYSSGCNLLPIMDRPVAIRFAFPSDEQVGKRLVDYSLPDATDLRAHGVLAAHVMLPRGVILDRVTSHPNRLAAVVATGETVDDAIRAANTALDHIVYTFEEPND